MEQVNLQEEKILEILCDLEYRLPKRNFSLYIPSDDFDSKDIISVQKEASKMMKHLGMNDYIATITYEVTKDGTGGYINLNLEKEVWIVVDRKNNHIKEQVLAIMAHEVCHKYLYINGVHFSEPFGNILEYYTDLATIFVGFSILTLNGCKVQHSEVKRSVSNGYIEQRTTYQTGYLVKRNFEFAHTIVLQAYDQDMSEANLHLKEKVSGLENLLSVKHYKGKDFSVLKERIVGNYAKYNQYLCVSEAIIKQLRQAMKDDVLAIQKSLAVLSDDGNHINADKVFSDLSHASKTKTLQQADVYDCLFKLIKTFRNCDAEAWNNTVSASRLQIVCPCCGFKSTKEREENRYYTLKCPKCKNEFSWDTRTKYASGNILSKLFNIK